MIPNIAQLGSMTGPQAGSLGSSQRKKLYLI